MADRMLFISWSEVVRGREQRALEVFNQTLGMLGRFQQDGKIDSFDVRLLAPGAPLGGYVEVYGAPAQLAALKEDPEFGRAIVDAALIVDDYSVVDGYCDQGVADELAIYEEAIAEVPQTTG